MVNDIAVQELVSALKDTPQDSDTTYSAVVSRVDKEGVVWVNLYGSQKETPTASTSSEVKPGDVVNVSWRNNKLYIGGNYTNPSAGMQTVQPSVDFVTELIDKDVTVKSINAATGYIGELESKNIKAEDITADHASIRKLNVDDVNAASGYIKDLKADNITTEDIKATTGYIEDLTSKNITAEDISADHAAIESLDSNYAHIKNGVIDNAKIGYADVDDLDAHYANIDLANVNTAWIEQGNIKKAEVFDENVFDLSGNRATISRIDASKINVANLRADNLIVRRINGQPVVGGYTLIDSTSSGYDTKNPKALGWYEYVDLQWVESTDTKVDRSKAYYQEGDEVSLYDQQYIDDLENDLQQQIDGAVETFTGTVVPTLTNYPYNEWHDTSVTPVKDERAKHVGDIYYVVNKASDNNGYCYRFAYDNTNHTYDWVLIKDSDVTKALGDITDLKNFESTTTSWMDETDEGIETIRTNHTTLSGIVDKTVKESVQLWFTKANTTAPAKPTAEVTSETYITDQNGDRLTDEKGDYLVTANRQSNTWTMHIPEYSSATPYYFYCFQYKYVDGSVGWSDVVYDISASETQGLSRDAKNTADNALPKTTFASFESTTFKRVTDTVDEQSVKFTNMTARLGMNADGTGATTDIVAKESALEETVDGISTRVGKTETYLMGMYATSTTAEGTAAKVATITPALPTDNKWELGKGATITVKFVNKNTTASPTLNVNGTGAKAIKTYANGNLTKAEYEWAAGTTFTFTYNGTNWLMQDSTASMRMSSAETSIKQNSEAITLRATKSEAQGYANTAEGNAKSYADAQIKVSADGITSRVGKTETYLIGMYATSTTAEGTAAKVATITPALPTDNKWELGKGATITVKFVNKNTTASPTLNVNDTGAKAIKTYANGNLTKAEYEWAAGTTFTFTYNGANWLMQDSTASMRMSSAETSIKQTATSIESLAAANETYTKPDGTVVTNPLKSAITQQADRIGMVVANKDASSKLELTADAMTYVGEHVEIKDSKGTSTVISGGKIKTKGITADEIDASNLHVKAANIDDKLVAKQIDATDLHVKAANIDDKLVAKQIDATDLHVKAANIDDKLKASQIETSEIHIGDIADGEGILSLTTSVSYSGANAVLTAKLSQAGKDVTSDYPASDYEWYYRYPGEDVYINTGRSLSVPAADNAGKSIVCKWIKKQTVYLTDSNGNYLTDSNGNRITAYTEVA